MEKPTFSIAYQGSIIEIHYQNGGYVQKTLLNGEAQSYKLDSIFDIPNINKNSGTIGTYKPFYNYIASVVSSYNGTLDFSKNINSLSLSGQPLKIYTTTENPENIPIKLAPNIEFYGYNYSDNVSSVSTSATASSIYHNILSPNNESVDAEHLLRGGVIESFYKSNDNYKIDTSYYVNGVMQIGNSLIKDYYGNDTSLSELCRCLKIGIFIYRGNRELEI